jgi:hypothetical protein
MQQRASGAVEGCGSHGLVVAGLVAEVAASKCTFTQNGVCGIAVHAQGTAAGWTCVSSDNGAFGFFMHMHAHGQPPGPPAMRELRGMAIQALRCGISARAAAQLQSVPAVRASRGM